MFALLAALTRCAEPPVPFHPTPLPQQIRFHREELSAFVHFGMNTFTGNEWGNGKEDEKTFNPTGLDTDQWVQVLKAAGFKRILLTSKHHDGFCIFNSKYTTHQVNASTQWIETAKKLGKSIDVFEEFSKSCTKYDMNVGLYLSLWDMNSPYYGQGDAYDKYYKAQLTEILGQKKYGNNGRFVEVWMDGAHDPSKPWQPYKFTEYFDLIWQLQPECTIYSCYGSTARWSGTESGGVGETSWSKINQSRMRSYYDEHHSTEPDYLWTGDPHGDIWTNAECDCSISPAGWFHHPNTKPKAMKEVARIYFDTVGHGEPLLMNVPPAKNGSFEKAFVDRVTELGTCINNTFKLNLVQLPGVKATASSVRGNDDKFGAKNVLDKDINKYWTMNDGQLTGSLEIDLGTAQSFDIFQISEHFELGQRVKSFSIEVCNRDKWTLVGKYTTIGAKRLVRTKGYTGDKVRFNITDSFAVPLIESVGLFKAYGGFALESLGSTENQRFNNTMIAVIPSVCLVLCIVIIVYVVMKRRKQNNEEALLAQSIVDYTENQE